MFIVVMAAVTDVAAVEVCGLGGMLLVLIMAMIHSL